MNVFDQKILVPENVLTKEQFISLPKKKKVEYLDAMIQIQETNARRNILTWFPDTGPYRRELYKKHVEFFDKGAEYKERLFMAANRCLTYETPVETPDGEIPIGELYERGEEFDVYSWDGEKKVIARAEAPFKKPLPAECVRLVMADGRWMECSLEHKLLTTDGWKDVASLLDCSNLPEFPSCDTTLISKYDSDTQSWLYRPKEGFRLWQVHEGSVEFSRPLSPWNSSDDSACFSNSEKSQVPCSDDEGYLWKHPSLLQSHSELICPQQQGEETCQHQTERACLEDNCGQPHSQLCGFSASHLQTSSAHDLSNLPSDGRHWNYTGQDFQDGYQLGSRLDGEQLLEEEDICQSSLPSQDDVQPHRQPLSRLDGQVCKCSGNSLSSSPHLSSQDDFPRGEGQAPLSQSHATCTISRLSNGQDQEVQQPSGVAFLHPQPSCESLQHKQDAVSTQYVSESCALSRNLQLQSGWTIVPRQSLRETSHGQSFPSLSLYPWKPSLIGTNKIIAYQRIGVKDVYTFTVPKYHNYYNCGVISKNSGKSLAASYEVALHATGMYPHWWKGHRFTKPIRCWVSSKTSSMTRDFVQRYLLGPWGHFGTGMIPGDCFTDKDWTPKRGIPEAIDTIRIHGTFGESEIGFKSFDQTWIAFQGVEMDLIWNDEECDELVHNECLTRLMTTKGIYMMTFTPLQGLTKVVRGYLGESLKVENKSKYAYVVNCGWDDAAHLSKAEKEHQWERTPPYLRDAKAKGLPAIGSGAIYPIPENDLKITPFKIPDYWPRAFAMDVGWNRTAALWGALDRENDILYLYSEYYRGQAEPSVHADGIRARGSWIPGVIDPASRGRNQKDGTQLFQIYTDLGLDIEKSKNAVEAGIAEVWQRMSSGRIKIFSTLQNLFTEIRMYHRDENGKIVKQDDHLLDCLKYLILSGLSRATTKAEIEREHTGQVNPYTAVDRVIGY